MKYLLTAACLFALTGCALTTPVLVKTSNGDEFLGSATASALSGSFEVVDSNGLKCHGAFDPNDGNVMMTVKITCDDGRHGVIYMQRNAILGAGTGIGKMSDGTKIKVLTGNYSTHI